MDMFLNRWIGFSELRDLNPEWRSVLSLGVRYTYPKGTMLEWKDALSFLDAGKIRLMHVSPEGTEKVMWYIAPGCLFGETPFLDPLESQGFAVCVEPCVVYTFSRECVLGTLYRTRPDLIANLLHSMARKIRIMSGQAMSLFLDDVPIRVCKFLAQRLVPESKPLLAHPGISQQEMSSLLGVHRIHLYRVLKQQEEEGLLGPFSKDGVVILDEERFMKLARS